MLVNKRSMHEVFDPTGRFEAPLFQRPYVWNEEENWQPLWESIVQVADKRVETTARRPHFLGTVVLDQDRTATGSVQTRQIIDGQQRLTTLQLLLAAVRDLCKEWDVDKYQRAFAKLTTNDTPLSDNEDDQYKIWPTNVDQPAYRAVMAAGSRGAVIGLQANYPESLLPRAYLYFAGTAAGWLGDPAGEKFTARLHALYNTLREDLSLVVIDLDQADDAQVIFETLNALGTPLLPADLVKNFLFHQARIEGEDTEKLYNRYWRQFDDDQAFWRREIVRGRLRTPQIDVYLQHYLTLMMGEDVSANQLFSTFRALARREPREVAVRHIERFREYADIYRDFSEFPEQTREGTFFERLNALDTTTVFPLLLEVFRRLKSPGESLARLQVLGDLESFLVRRMVCELTAKSYTRFFAESIKKLWDADDFSASTIRRVLLEQTAEASRWPSDDEFRVAWMELRLYKKLNRSRTRMILQALDRALQNPKTESIVVTGSLSIEHLLPQNWAKHWPLPATRLGPDGVAQSITPDEAEEWRESLLHTIGNLTLVTEALNASVSNGPWPAKKAEILHHSALNLNRRFQGAEEWTEQSILKRSQELFEVALTIWPRAAA